VRVLWLTCILVGRMDEFNANVQRDSLGDWGERGEKATISRPEQRTLTSILKEEWPPRISSPYRSPCLNLCRKKLDFFTTDTPDLNKTCQLLSSHDYSLFDRLYCCYLECGIAPSVGQNGMCIRKILIIVSRWY